MRSPRPARSLFRASLGFAVLAAASFEGGASTTARPASAVSHEMKVSLDPESRRLEVTDIVRLPGLEDGASVDFLLNPALTLTGSSPEAREVPLDDEGASAGAGAGACLAGGPPPKRYRVRSTSGDGRLQVSYEGVIDFALSPEKEQYTRGFRQTAGTVGPEGVYLAASSCWYPTFGPGLVTFSAHVEQPEGWHTISEGSGTSRDAAGLARWESKDPLEEIHLVGGPLHVFRERAGDVEALVYLHDSDRPLAEKYLAATRQYLAMYEGLIGPYPYSKFALVENFWETGYGMPSFTLLGREVIRFPFIITSSYPHEILHNWWGNSVFVDERSGNWSEGLTAYLADHMLQEQRGAGAEYRRAVLQKYRNYVKEGRDFALDAFRGRDSASTEAVGYGKSLMAFHMLRRSLGDDAFRQVLSGFYRDFKGSRASFSDIRATAEAVTGRDLRRFFRDWVARAGAPALSVQVLRVGSMPAAPAGEGQKGADTHVVEAVLRQVQGGEAYALDVPVVVQTASGVTRQMIELETAERRFTVSTQGLPLALHVDPDFDVFRKLDARETPASIGQIFGEPRVLAVLPSAAPEAERDAWRSLFEGWTSASHAIEIKEDSELAELPPDRAAWVAGRANRFAEPLLARQPGIQFGDGRIGLNGQAVPLSGHTLVAVTRHPRNDEKAIGWLAVDPPDAFPGLGRKLPHYGKYSYLAFEGSEPANVVKGQWPASDSPLTIDLSRPGPANASTAAVATALPPLQPERRSALAELPPAFSSDALAAHVAFLADPARAGRVPGSKGHDQAASYIAGQFEALGLLPGGDEGSYFQSFALAPSRERASAGGERDTAANVIGFIPGSRADWRGQAVVVSAHYDHLGTGWPDVHKGDEGRVHPGADDNASGVAVMLELARAFASGDRPSRSIVFVAFTGEEAGLLGSTHYVEHPGAFPVEKTIGVINLDTVGRLGERPLSVLGTGSASEWQHIFRGASFVTGLQSVNVPASPQSSDHVSFTRKGVPAVQLFAGAHGDYHRPGDTPEKLDLAGLAGVAAFTREAVAYLAERPQPLTASATAAGTTAAPGGGQKPGERRSSVGTVPDFAFAGPGVRVSGVVAGSPAEKAGLREGDILMAIDGSEIPDLKAYSELLRALTPGQEVRLRVVRDGRELTLGVTLGER